MKCTLWYKIRYHLLMLSPRCALSLYYYRVCLLQALIYFRLSTQGLLSRQLSVFLGDRRMWVKLRNRARLAMGIIVLKMRGLHNGVLLTPKLDISRVIVVRLVVTLVRLPWSRTLSDLLWTVFNHMIRGGTVEITLLISVINICSPLLIFAAGYLMCERHAL